MTVSAETVRWLVAVFQREGAHLIQPLLCLRHDPANIGFLLVAQAVAIFAEKVGDLGFHLCASSRRELGHGCFGLLVQLSKTLGGLCKHFTRVDESRSGSRRYAQRELAAVKRKFGHPVFSRLPFAIFHLSPTPESK